MPFTANSSKGSDPHIGNLCTEYTTTPLGFDVLQPRFSWQMVSKIPGSFQKAYQIKVTDEAGQVVWDSGKTKSNVSLNIKYSGTALRPTTRYHWIVCVWDQSQKKHVAESWFETGLMNPDPQLTAWNGARWIGGTDDDLTLYSDYLPVFKINVSMQLDRESGSTRAGFIYGANDRRLRDKNNNIYQLESMKDSSYILVELDIAPLNENKPAQLNVFRKGYSPNDKNGIPFKSFLIPDSVINNKNRYEAHVLYLSSVLGDTKFFINGEGSENLLGQVNLNPLGRGGDYIAYPVVA